MTAHGGTAVSAPQACIHTIGDACIIADRDFRILNVNAAAEHLYMYAHGSMQGLPLVSLCAHDSKAKLADALDALEGAARTIRVHQTRNDGSVFTADVCAKCSYANGRTVVLTIREVALVADDGIAARLLHHHLDPTYVYRPDGTLVYANASAYRLWHMPASTDPRSLEPWSWIPSHDRLLVSHRLNVVLDTGMIVYEGCFTIEDMVSHCEIIERSIAWSDGGDAIMATVHDISSRKRAEDEVRYLAYHDALTGLANRIQLQQELAHAVSAAERHQDIVGLVYVDLDRFKPVNDTFGHAVGDAVLRRVAERMISCVRLTDTVSRIGGDEFVVLLPRLSSLEDLPDVARKISEAVSRPMSIGTHTVTVSCTVGVAVHEPGQSADTLLQSADAEMYRSRESGVPGWLTLVT